MRHAEPDIVIVGAGIAGGALGTVLAGARFEVALLDREKSYPDRVRGEFMAPWGVTELAKLELRLLHGCRFHCEAPQNRWA